MSGRGVGYVVEITDPRFTVEARIYGLFAEQPRAVEFARRVTAYLAKHDRPVRAQVRMLWPPSMATIERWWLT